MTSARISQAKNGSSEHASSVDAGREPRRAPSFLGQPAVYRPSRLLEPVAPDAQRDPKWRVPLGENSVNGILIGRSMTGAGPRSSVEPEEVAESKRRILVSRLSKRPILIGVALVAVAAVALAVWGPNGGSPASADLLAPATAGGGVPAGDLGSRAGSVEPGSVAAPIQADGQPQWLTVSQPLGDDSLQLIADLRNPDGAQAISGQVGPQGAQGAPGLAGPAGPQGAEGPQGETGSEGAAGLAGPVGSQGAGGSQGETGLSVVGTQGAQGPSGEIGPRGLTGLQGPAGLQGEAGAPGSEGAQGQPGDQGLQGLLGPLGAQGLQGGTGLSGPAGPQGVAGLSGPAGPQGSAGPQGPQGQQGPPGLIGVETVSALSIVDSSAAKVVSVICPTGKRLIGGGAALLLSGPDDPDFLALTANAPVDNVTWSARGIETSASSESWQLTAHAICADEAPQ